MNFYVCALALGFAVGATMAVLSLNFSNEENTPIESSTFVFFIFYTVTTFPVTLPLYFSISLLMSIFIFCVVIFCALVRVSGHLIYFGPVGAAFGGIGLGLIWAFHSQLFELEKKVSSKLTFSSIIQIVVIACHLLVGVVSKAGMGLEVIYDVFVVISVFGTVIFLFYLFRDMQLEQNEYYEKGEEMDWKDRRIILLLFSSLSFGGVQGFIYSTFIRDFVEPELGTSGIGFIMAILSFFALIFSALFYNFGVIFQNRRKTRLMGILLSFFTYSFSLLLLMGFFPPEGFDSGWGVLVPVAISLGIGNAVWSTVFVFCVIAHFSFAKKLFPVHRFVSNIGATLFLSLSVWDDAFMPVQSLLTIVILMVLLGTFALFFIDAIATVRKME